MAKKVILHNSETGRELKCAQRDVDEALIAQRFKKAIKRELKMAHAIGIEKWERLIRARQDNEDFEKQKGAERVKLRKLRRDKRARQGAVVIDLDREPETFETVLDRLSRTVKSQKLPEPPVQSPKEEIRLTLEQVEKQRKMASFLIKDSASKEEYDRVLGEMEHSFDQEDYDKVFELSLQTDASARPVVRGSQQYYQQGSAGSAGGCDFIKLIDEAIEEFKHENDGNDSVNISNKIFQALLHAPNDLEKTKSTERECVKCPS